MKKEQNQPGKRRLVLGLSCLLLLCASLPVAAQNYLANASFENGSTGWFPNSSCTVQFDTPTGEGRYASDTVKITSATACDSSWLQVLSMNAGTTYALSGYIKGSNVSGGYGAGIGCYGSSVTAETAGLYGTFDWTYVRITFTAESIGTVRLRLGNQAGGSSGEVWFDDITLVKVRPAANELLILCSKALLDANMQSALTTYRADILNEGWESILKTVSIDHALSPNWYCPDDVTLKNFIEQEYSAGIDGVLFVGSPPDLPPAFFHEKVNDSGYGATDLFFVTIGETWFDTDNNGIYEYRDANGVPLHAMSLFAPDMFYGRISGARTTRTPTGDLLADERVLVVDYFTKIHEYRGGGRQLPPGTEGRALFFTDDDWSFKTTDPDPDANCALINMQQAFPDLDVYYDTEVTNRRDVETILQQGYVFADMGHHSGEFANWYTDPAGNFTGQNFASYFSIQDLNDLGPEGVKIRLLSLFSCEEGEFATRNSAGTTKSQSSFGASYLFNNNYTLNVLAASIGGVSLGDETFFVSLHNQRTVGEALLDHFPVWQQEHGSANVVTLLLGDPLITYPNLLTAENKGPKIYNDLKNLEAQQGQTFQLDFDIRDPENDTVLLDIQNLPDGAYVSGNTSLIWDVSSSQVEKNYTMTAVATDSHGNSYSETFTVYASHFANGIMKFVPGQSFSGWEPDGANYELSTAPCTCDNVTNPVWNNPLRDRHWNMQTNNGYMILHQHVSVKPGTDYKLVYFTHNELDVNSDEAFISIAELGLEIRDLNETLYCSQEYTFSTGTNTSLTIALNSGRPGTLTTGNLWIVGLKLVDQGPTSDPFSAGGEVCLSDIPWEYAYSTWDFVHRDTYTDGNPLAYGGLTYAKGLGVTTNSEIRYRLGGRCSVLNITVPHKSYINHVIYADGQVIYGTPYPAGDPVQLQLNVSGVETLTLKANHLSTDTYKTCWLDARVTVAPSNELEVLYQAEETAAITTTMRPWLQIHNTGTTPLNLEDVTIRYWFITDTADPQNFFCDWAQVGAQNVTGCFVSVSPGTPGADNYLEVGFTAGAGSVAPDAMSGEIQLSIWKDSLPIYWQSNDYSFDDSMTTYGLNPTVTGYINGNLVFGTEP